jgi:hypothetical protein
VQDRGYCGLRVHELAKDVGVKSASSTIISRPRASIYTQTLGPIWVKSGTEIETGAGTVRLAGVLGCLEHPRDPRSMSLFRRLVREALPKIAVENGGPNLKQKMSAPF